MAELFIFVFLSEENSKRKEIQTMSIVKDVSDLCIELRNEARQNKQFELADKLCSIQDKLKELSEENDELRRQLSIKEKIKYDESDQTFILTDNPRIHFCSVCYGHSGTLIPVSDLGDGKYRCRVCEEIWHGKRREKI